MALGEGRPWEEGRDAGPPQGLAGSGAQLHLPVSGETGRGEGWGFLLSESAGAAISVLRSCLPRAGVGWGRPGGAGRERPAPEPGLSCTVGLRAPRRSACATGGQDRRPGRDREPPGRGDLPLTDRTLPPPFPPFSHSSYSGRRHEWPRRAQFLSSRRNRQYIWGAFVPTVCGVAVAGKGVGRPWC